MHVCRYVLLLHVLEQILQVCLACSPNYKTWLLMLVKSLDVKTDRWDVLLGFPPGVFHSLSVPHGLHSHSWGAHSLTSSLPSLQTLCSSSLTYFPTVILPVAQHRGSPPFSACGRFPHCALFRHWVWGVGQPFVTGNQLGMCSSRPSSVTGWQHTTLWRNPKCYFNWLVW